MGFPHPQPQAGPISEKQEKISSWAPFSQQALQASQHLPWIQFSWGPSLYSKKNSCLLTQGPLCCLRLWEVNHYLAQGNIFSLCEGMIKEECHLNQGKQNRDLYLGSLQRKESSWLLQWGTDICSAECKIHSSLDGF